MIQVHHLMKKQEFVHLLVKDIFQHLDIMKTLIGYLYQQNTMEIVQHLLVIMYGITIQVGRLPILVVIGLTVLLLVLSFGVFMMLLLFVIVISAVAWCMYLMLLNVK